jgi:hypothetical protein
MLCAWALCRLEQVCALAGGGDGLVCPGLCLPGTMVVAAAELSGGAGGDARSGASGDANGANVALDCYIV